jgi:hypothetical protein
VTLMMVRNAAYTNVTLLRDTMTGMDFSAEGDPVQLTAKMPPPNGQQATDAPDVRMICRARAGIQMLQPKVAAALWQQGLPIDVSVLYALPVGFDGHMSVHSQAAGDLFQQGAV